jgi:hypothetical protein
MYTSKDPPLKYTRECSRLSYNDSDNKTAFFFAGNYYFRPFYKHLLHTHKRILIKTAWCINIMWCDSSRKRMQKEKHWRKNSLLILMTKVAALIHQTMNHIEHLPIELLFSIRYDKTILTYSQRFCVYFHMNRWIEDTRMHTCIRC